MNEGSAMMLTKSKSVSTALDPGTKSRKELGSPRSQRTWSNLPWPAPNPPWKTKSEDASRPAATGTTSSQEARERRWTGGAPCIVV